MIGPFALSLRKNQFIQARQPSNGFHIMGEAGCVHLEQYKSEYSLDSYEFLYQTLINTNISGVCKRRVSLFVVLVVVLVVVLAVIMLLVIAQLYLSITVYFKCKNMVIVSTMYRIQISTIYTGQRKRRAVTFGLPSLI